MKKGEMLTNMLSLATIKHAGQYDKGGQPYVMHVLKVMYYAKTDDEELQCICLGHDLIEDCGVTYQDLHELGFTQRVVNGIRGLTKVPGETNIEYMTRIKANKDCIHVKLCDLRHNSDIRRLKGVTSKDIARIEKYHQMYMELRELI
jgi:(p)ppGpp synthase/HD superfamily hydrolase